MNIFQRVWESFGGGDQYDDFDYEYDYDETGFPPADGRVDEMVPPGRDRPVPPNNVIGMPNRAVGQSEVVLMQPRSFEDIPQTVNLLRERKSVILNLSLMDPDQAQRSVDFVAGGVFAIDGHQERLGENIFLFTPNIVNITAYPQILAATTQFGAAPGQSMQMPPISPTIYPSEGQFPNR